LFKTDKMMKKLKIGDNTNFGKVVASFKEPTYVISFSIEGFNQKKIDYIVNKIVDAYLEAFIGKNNIYIYGKDEITIFTKIDDIIPKVASETNNAIAITDKDVIMTTDDLHENKKGVDEHMKKEQLIQLIKEIIFEETVFSGPESMIKWIGSEITAAHWSVIYKWIQNGDLKLEDLKTILKHYEILK